jgi:regulator of protease activity HflC (stomatin/prohibitin superfamily)
MSGAGSGVPATEPRRRDAIAAGILAALAFVLLIGYSASFTVYQIEQALVMCFGRPVRTVTEPRLSFKFPLIDSIIRIDSRLSILRVHCKK